MNNPAKTNKNVQVYFFSQMKTYVKKHAGFAPYFPNLL